MENCLFCKIINKEAPADLVYEDNKLAAFKDINPKAEVHILIVPKKHIVSIAQATEEDRELIGDLFLAAKKIAWARNLKGYKLVINVGREAGQMVEHLHLHLLGGDPMNMP